jgi:hypothetical protein
MPSRSARRRSPWIAFAASISISIACALFAASASAEPEPVRLAWVRGPGAEACSSQLAVVQQISARLGRSPFTADAPRSIDAYVIRAEAGWRAEIYVRDPDGKLAGARVLTSDALDCGAIESATVLALALAIDPEGALRAPDPPPVVAPPAPVVAPRLAPPPIALPPIAPAPPSIAPPPIAPPPIAPADPPSIGLGASGIALRGAVGLGLLPRAAAGLSLAAHVAISPSWAITGEALWMPEVAATDDRFAFGLSAFALGACAGVARSSSVDLAACGAIWGGALHAVVRGLTPTEPGDRAWAAGSLTPRLRVGLASRLHLELGAQLFVPFVRRPFTVIGFASPVFQQAAVAVLPFAGLGANFP